MVLCSVQKDCVADAHFIDCPLVPDAERAERYKGLYQGMLDRANIGRKQRERLTKEIELWRGKFREVKHENNQMRNRLYRSAHKRQVA